MTTVNKSITLDYRVNDDGVTDEYEEFIAYVNEYVAYCRDKGAEVYFTFCPMMDAAMSDYNTEENLYAFYDNLAKSLDCRIISNLNDYIMNEGYFFDTEFHLNNSGVKVRTAMLIDDLKAELGYTDITLRDDLPKPSGYAPLTFSGNMYAENSHFILELIDSLSGQDIYAIVGLTEEGKRQTVLNIPAGTDGIAIAKIYEGALNGAEARKLYVGENVSAIDPGAFGGASSLAEVYVTAASPTDISIADGNHKYLATEGAPDSLKIYVPTASLEEYKADYSWGNYVSRLRGY